MLPRFILFAFLFHALASGLLAADAAMTEWKDAKGVAFRGEPVEAMGALALFRTGPKTSRFLPMAALSADDCVRFRQAIAGLAPRAEKWSEAKGKATSEFVGRVTRVENSEARPIDLAALPEPELLLVLGGSPRSESFYPLLNDLAPFAMRVQRVFPGRVMAVVIGTWNRPLAPKSIPGAGPWLLPDPQKISRMKMLERFMPEGGFAAVLMTREGVPLIGGYLNDSFEVMKFVDGASAILWELNPVNPRTWHDRLHYQRAVRPVEFAQSAAPPIAIADPFRADVLRARGVKRIAAEVAVDAEGQVTEVTMTQESDFPLELTGMLSDGLRRSGVFLPAIDHGHPRAGTCDYSYVVPPSLDPKLAADTAWVCGEARLDVPFASWLVLKPIRVPESAFSVVTGVGEDGVVRMSAVTAGEEGKVSKAAQQNAFNSDWFAKDGAVSVHPADGAEQEVDGVKLKWQRLIPRDGYVDLLRPANYGSRDYCVGYAWTEVEVDRDTDAWLGIGSDDGLKIWVNGQLAADQWVRRSSKLDDEVVPMRLRAGKNQLLVKIQNMTGLWSFTGRLRVRGK